MNNSVMLAKNYETNNYKPLHCDAHGIQWDKLKHERNDARCYIVNCEKYISTTGSNETVLSIFNTSGSTVKIGLYNLRFSYSSGGTSGYVYYNLHTLSTQPTGGTLKTPINLKLGHSSPPTSIQVRQAPTTISLGSLMDRRLRHMSSATNDVDTFIQESFIDEIIEIPANNGIAISGQLGTGTTPINAYANIRFVVIDEGDDI